MEVQRLEEVGTQNTKAWMGRRKDRSGMDWVYRIHVNRTTTEAIDSDLVKVLLVQPTEWVTEGEAMTRSNCLESYSGFW